VSEVLVVCLGNSLVGDDRVGPRVHALLEAQGLPPGARARLLGLGGFNLLDELDGEHTLLVVDAVQLGVQPGTVHVLPWDQLPNAGSAISLHGIGLREAMEVGRKLFPERMPARAMLVGVEGRCFDQIEGPMAPEVEAGIERAAAEVRRLATATIPSTSRGR
jgi:hydrogenase maturation protease